LIESIGMHRRAGLGSEAPIYHFLILDKGMKRDWHYATYVESGSIFVEVAT
jgi:hypothetical protein